MKRRKSFGIKIIGKSFQFNGDQYAVIKTDKGFYARCKGKNWHKIGHRHTTAHKARNELMGILKVAKGDKLAETFNRIHKSGYKPRWNQKKGNWVKGNRRE